MRGAAAGLAVWLALVMVAAAVEDWRDCLAQNCQGVNVTLVPVCTTYGETALVPSHGMPYGCPNACRVGARYVGVCGCPNNCSGHGTCGEDGAGGECVCADGWGGPDCSAFRCPFDCSGHGWCEPGAEDDSSPARCVCDSDWTAVDCSVATIARAVAVQPYGEWFPDALPYYVDDDYGDDHPLFNMSAVFALRIEVDETALDFLLGSADEDGTFPANVSFDNGATQFSLDNIGIKLKGHRSRNGMRKNFHLKFDAFTPEATVFGVDSVAIKAAGDDPTQMRVPVYTSWLRALHVPVSRLGIGEVWLNGVFHGLYHMIEDVDGHFLKSRFGEKQGNLYSAHAGGLSYWGNTSEDYSSVHAWDGSLAYELEREGDAPWGDFMTLVSALHGNNVSIVEEALDRTSFIRAMVAEIHGFNMDAYSWNHNNYRLYNHNGQLSFLPYDFDLSMCQVWEGQIPIVTFCHPANMGACSNAPLTDLLFSNESWWGELRETYLTFFAGANASATIGVIDTLATTVTALLPRDPFYTLETGTIDNLPIAIDNMREFLQLRDLVVYNAFLRPPDMAAPAEEPAPEDDHLSAAVAAAGFAGGIAVAILGVGGLVVVRFRRKRATREKMVEGFGVLPSASGASSVDGVPAADTAEMEEFRVIETILEEPELVDPARE